MSFTRHCFNECNFMLTRVFGEINDKELANHVVQINKKLEDKVNVKELADCRELTNMHLTTQGTTLNASHEHNKPGSYMAILVPQEHDMIFAMARTYQIFSEEFRDHVNIFSHYDEAISWLTSNNEEEAHSINEFIKNA